MASTPAWNGAPVLFHGAPMSAGILRTVSSLNTRAAYGAYSGSGNADSGQTTA